MSNVYWIKGRTRTIYQSLISKINSLIGLEEMARMIKPETSIAVKINISELGYPYYLPPVVIASFFEKIRDLGAMPVVTDSTTLFKGSRSGGYEWTNTAIVQGFGSGETFDNQLMMAAGYTGEEGNFYPCRGNHLGGIEIGSLLTDTGNLVVISHVTAHPLLGISGALANLGLGFLTGAGKLRVHECLKLSFSRQTCTSCKICLPFCPTGAVAEQNNQIEFDDRICNGCLGCFITCPEKAFAVVPETVPVFQETVAEAAVAAKSHVRGHAFFINFLTSVTPQTDDYPFSDIPFIPDLGIIASDDPVAADWATYQMITRSPGIPGSIAQELNVTEKGQDKIRAITGQTPEHMLEYAENMKLGSKTFDFLTADQ